MNYANVIIVEYRYIIGKKLWKEMKTKLSEDELEIFYQLANVSINRELVVIHDQVASQLKKEVA